MYVSICTGEPTTTNISLIWFNNGTKKADPLSDICQMDLPGMKFKPKFSRQETSNHRNGSKEFFFTASYYIEIINITSIMPAPQFTLHIIIKN